MNPTDAYTITSLFTFIYGRHTLLGLGLAIFSKFWVINALLNTLPVFNWFPNGEGYASPVDVYIGWLWVEKKV